MSRPPRMPRSFYANQRTVFSRRCLVLLQIWRFLGNGTEVATKCSQSLFGELFNMNNSWHLGRIAGIDVRIHWTFLLLPVWIYLSNIAAGTGALAATVAVLFVLAIFGCVVLHELGHSLTARRFGISTRDITLLPIGGVASLERMPRSPWQELAIAVAGPAVNVVIAAALFVGLPLVSFSLPTAVVGFLSSLAWVNVGLVVFNMLPAFPMDGGRVLRATLALRMPYRQATHVAVGVGKFVAFGLGLLGLMTGNLMLVFVAGFVFLAARGEVMMAEHGEDVGAAPNRSSATRSSSAASSRTATGTRSTTSVATLIDAKGNVIAAIPPRSNTYTDSHPGSVA